MLTRWLRARPAVDRQVILFGDPPAEVIADYRGVHARSRFQAGRDNADIRIVDKHDHSVLEETEGKRLTLVTCYPFYYAGHAPQRFIVTALPAVVPGE